MKLSWISFATSCAVAVVSSSAASTSKVTNDDLEQLYGKLSTFAVPKRVDPNAWLRECAYYIMKPDYNGSNAGEGAVDEHWILADYFYKGAKHGACTMKLESALGMSWNYTLKHVLDEFFDGIEPGSQELAELDVSGILNSIPEMTLPSLIAEPRTAKDAVEVVKFAKDHDLQVSVKNTGHDYAGQSDVKDSFQLNMRNFPKYSKDGAVECKKGSETSPLEGPPCKLALARGKEAIVRVSGSEGNDSVYQSVHNWNHQMPRDKRFQVSGGGEGAIGAGGGYLMGGGLGMGANDNKWGIFIDQVLELEMVLANGQHVKFGPSEWDVVEGHIYPQTRKVKGLCNKNVHHLEEEWEWGECDEDIPFEDLWFAVRGGGGGTWGVLISSWHQLHDDEEWYILNSNGEASRALKEKCKRKNTCDETELEQMANKMWIDFFIHFLYGPMTEEFGNDESDSCGSNEPDLAIGGVPLSLDGPSTGLLCIGKTAAEKLVRSWQKYIPTSKYLSEDMDVELLKYTISMDSTGGTWGDVLLRSPLIGVWDSIIANNTITLSDGIDSPTKPNPFMKTPAGLAFSKKTAGVYSPYLYNLLLPTKMLLEKGDLAIELLTKVCSGVHTWGRNAAISSDGMDSMNKLFRESFMGCQFGLESVEGVNTYEELDAYYSKVQSKIMEFVSEDDKKNNIFPGIQEKNHVQGNTPLPLKDDWTKVCPYDLPTEERKEKCMSVQESIWGTENMERMEKIKKELDPDNMFQVYIGIGQRDVSQQQEYKWPTQLPENYTPVSVSYNSGADAVVKDDDDDSSGNRRHLRGQN